jgi:hypothetical protein
MNDITKLTPAQFARLEQLMLAQSKWMTKAQSLAPRDFRLGWTGGIDGHVTVTDLDPTPSAAYLAAQEESRKAMLVLLDYTESLGWSNPCGDAVRLYANSEMSS